MAGKLNFLQCFETYEGSLDLSRNEEMVVSLGSPSLLTVLGHLRSDLTVTTIQQTQIISNILRTRKEEVLFLPDFSMAKSRAPQGSGAKKTKLPTLPKSLSSNF